LLTQSMLEQLRLLCSAHMDSQSLATLLLVGHPSLRTTLAPLKKGCLSWLSVRDLVDFGG